MLGRSSEVKNQRAKVWIENRNEEKFKFLMSLSEWITSCKWDKCFMQKIRTHSKLSWIKLKCAIASAYSFSMLAN